MAILFLRSISTNLTSGGVRTSMENSVAKIIHWTVSRQFDLVVRQTIGIIYICFREFSCKAFVGLHCLYRSCVIILISWWRIRRKLLFRLFMLQSQVTNITNKETKKVNKYNNLLPNLYHYGK